MNMQRNNFRSDQAALDGELEDEILRMATTARRRNRVEAVMRLRALVEISEGLDTARLIGLAQQISTASLVPELAKRAC